MYDALETVYDAIDLCPPGPYYDRGMAAMNDIENEVRRLRKVTAKLGNARKEIYKLQEEVKHWKSRCTQLKQEVRNVGTGRND